METIIPVTLVKKQEGGRFEIYCSVAFADDCPPSLLRLASTWNAARSFSGVLQETAEAVHERAHKTDDVSEATIDVRLVREKEGNGSHGRWEAYCSAEFPAECPRWLTGWLSGRQMANDCGTLICREAERVMRARKSAAQ